MGIAYIQRFDGEWVDVTNGQLLACCDCGLVHDTEYAVLDGRILKRVFRDRKETSYRRKRKDVKASINTLKGEIMPHHTKAERRKKKKKAPAKRASGTKKVGRFEDVEVDESK